MKITRIIFLLFRFFIIPTCAYCIPSTGYAISIGEAEVQSALGTPLLAQVALRLREGEHIDNACLSLSATEDSAGFIPTDLTATVTPSKQQIIIKSRKEFNEVFAVFRLQIQCAGIGNISRIITLLPEIGVSPPPGTAPPGNISDVSTPTFAQSSSPKPTSEITQQKLQSPPVNNKFKKIQTKTASHLTTPTTALPENNRRKIIQRNTHERQFNLKLSGATLNLSLIGKMSTSDRESLLAQQKIQDNDDQTARLLSMQHQLLLMQEELSTVKLKLAEINARSIAGTKPIVATSVPSNTEKGTLNRFFWLFPFLLIPLAWFAMHHYKRSWPTKSRALFPSIESIPQSTDSFVKPASLNVINMAPENISHTNAANEAQKETSAIVEEDKGSLALLEEAELYAAYGHIQKAIVILEDFVIQYPDVEKGWILLLSIYSSRGQSEEFEKAARLFSLNNKNDHAWKMIQALGRTLDKTNPLYTSDSSPTILNTPLNSRNEHRPIGIILVDLGYLPLQDLELSLKGFDPDQHGRFGNHLVSRRQVSYAQLTEAVLAQQAHAMTLQPDTSITLQ